MTVTVQGPAIEVKDGELIVRRYRNSEALVAGHFRDLPSDAMSGELDRCLSLGVRVVIAASGTLDVELVKREFAATADRQKELLEEARANVLQDITAALNPVFANDGALYKALLETRRAIEAELRKYCDEESTRSISASVAKKVEDAVRASERRIDRNLVDALDLSDGSRGLGRVYKAIEAEKETVSGQLGELVALVSGLVSRREERQSSPRIGDDYEDAVLVEVGRIARVYGDFPEPTGRLTGEAKRKRGDILVTVDPGLTAGVEVRLTFEAMHRASGSLKAALKELDEAKANRAANGAVAVLSSRLAPAAGGQVLQRHSGSRFLCVVEEDGWDTLALEVAYCWARVDAITGSGASRLVEVDIEGAAAMVESAVRHLGDLERLRTKLGVGRNALKDAEGIISELEAKLTSCLTGVAAILGQRRQA